MMSLIVEPGEALVRNPSAHDLIRLGNGAVVCIYFSHMGEDIPFITTLNKVEEQEYIYYTEFTPDGQKMRPAAPMVYYTLPSEPDVMRLVDDNGWGICNAGHIVAIYDYGTPNPVFRNRLFKKRDAALKEQRVRGWRGLPYEGHNAWNRLRSGDYNRVSTATGQYSGDLFHLAKAIISRRPMLSVPTDLDRNRFIQAYTKARRPGWKGSFVDYWGEPAEVDYPAHGHVNIKAFTKWVLRAYRSFMFTHAEMVGEGMRSSREYELRQEKEFARDMEDSYGSYD